MTDTVIEIEAHNKSTFSILGPDKGAEGITMGKSPSGLYEPDPTDAIYFSHAFQRGATLAGIEIGKRDVKFKVHAVPTEYQTWQQNASDWVRSWSFEEPNKLWMRNEYGSRYLNLSLMKHISITPELNPDKIEYAELEMTCVAGDPSWHENTVKRTLEFETDTRNGSVETKHFEVSNPTDTPMYLQYVCQAAPKALWTLPDFSFGDNTYRAAVAHKARMVPLVDDLMAGEHLKVNTSNEEVQVQSDLDTQVYVRMKGRQFLYPIPPNTKKTLLPVKLTNAPPGLGIQLRMERRWSNVLVV